MPGMPSRWMSSLLTGRDFALEPDKAAFRGQPFAQFIGIEIGQGRGQQFDRFIDIDDPARLAKQRRHPHVGCENLAIAVENVRSRGRDDVLVSSLARVMTFGRGRKHHKPRRQ